jgi:hypothetical protein
VDPLVVFPLLFIAPAIGGGLAWWWSPRRRARRLLARAEQKPLGAVVDGDRVRVLGVVHRADGSMHAPLSGRPCLAFRAVVEEWTDDGGSEIFRLEHALPFVLVADGIEARVDGPILLGLEIDFRDGEGECSQAVLDALSTYGVPTTDPRGRRKRLRCHEAILEAGDPIWVLGRARVAVDRRGRSETLRGPPVLRVFQGTKRAPVVVADEDSPGRLDLDAR